MNIIPPKKPKPRKTYLSEAITIHILPTLPLNKNSSLTPDLTEICWKQLKEALQKDGFKVTRFDLTGEKDGRCFKAESPDKEIKQYDYKNFRMILKNIFANYIDNL
jgi:hypothetical protein